MASPFASLTTSDPIPLPFDEGQWIKVRKLTGREHEEAQNAHRLGFSTNPNKWAGFLRATAVDPTSTDVQRVVADPMTGYDRYVIAKAGLVAWSYDLAPAQAIDDLDDDAIEFIAREVLKLSKPSLFQSANEQEQEKKSGFGASTKA